MDSIKDLISVISKYIPDHVDWLLEIIKNPRFSISDYVKTWIFATINLFIGLTLQSRWNTFQGDLTANIITLLVLWGLFMGIFWLFHRLFGGKTTLKMAFYSGLQNISFIYLITNLAALIFYLFQSKIYDTKIFFLFLEFIFMIVYLPASLGNNFLKWIVPDLIGVGVISYLHATIAFNLESGIPLMNDINKLLK